MTRRRFSAWGAGKLRFEIEYRGGRAACLLPASDVIWLGRSPSCQLVLDAPEIEEQHLSIFTQHGKLFVRDHSGASRAPAPPAIRRLRPPAVLQLGPYRIQVALVSFWQALAGPLVQHGHVALGREGAGEQASAPRRRLCGAALLVAAALLAVGGARALLRSSRQPPVAAAACAVDRASIRSANRAEPTGAVSALRAVQLLRAGQKLEALAQYRALSARDDSPAPLAVVAGLLEYELACPR